MTIHQLANPCWEFSPLPSDAERYGHYGTRADAVTAIREAKKDDDCFNPATKPVQLGTACWVVQCDGACETVLDTEDEGWVFHHLTRAEAEETVAAYRWRPAGLLMFCEEDTPEDSQEPPLSPAEQEAAGQLVIPGVIP
jgi:hypothetical protein